MKIKCECCGKKFDVETDARGIPYTYKCDKCEEIEKEKLESLSYTNGTGKKKKHWWK